MADAAADAAAEAPPPTTPEEAVTHGYYVTKNLSPLDTDACRTLNDAVWTLSSARPGNGIPQLLNDDVRFRLVFCVLLCAPHSHPLPLPFLAKSCLNFGNLTAPPHILCLFNFVRAPP
jgi:hypothetical protein